MLAAEFGTGQVLWSVVWFALFVLWFWLVITIFADIMRADELSGWAKATWAVGIIVIPFIGIIMYLIVNGDAMNKRAVEDSRHSPIHDRPAGSTTAEELGRLASLRDTGLITDAEFDFAKARVLA